MKKRFFAFLIFALFLSIFSTIIRIDSGINTIPGIEPYFHLCASQNCLNEKIPISDEPFNYIITFFKNFNSNLLLFLPALTAFISFLLFTLITKKLGLDSLWHAFAFIASPIFITTSFYLFKYSFTLIMILLGILLLLSKKLKWLAIPFFIIAGTSGLIPIIAIIYFLIALIFLKPEIKKWCIFILSIIFFILLAGYFPPTIKHATGFSEIFSFFGGLFGISAFTIFLTITGTIKLWHNKKKFYFLFVLTLIFFTLTYFLPPLLIFGNVILAGISGFALQWLFKRKWKIKFIRSATLLVLFCGMLFSTVSHAFMISENPPNNTFFTALNFEKSNILSHNSYGFWIAYAGHSAITDPLYFTTPNGKILKKETDLIFNSTDLQHTTAFLKKHNITHILITDEMTSGLIWEKYEQGLVFLLENAKIFNKTFSKTNIAVWEVLDEE